MVFVIAAVAGIIILLVALKLWAQAKARPPRPVATGGMVYETSASKIDDFVVGAEQWTPHLRIMPLFWLALAGTLIILVLDFHFGYSRGSWQGLAILGSLFAMADAALPMAAMKHEVDDDADGITMFLIVVCTIMSMIVVIGSTAEISSVTGAKTDVGRMDYTDTLKLIETKQQERDSIKIDRGADALGGLAKSTEEAAAREGTRSKNGKGICADKCEGLQKEARDYREREAEAKRKEKLTGEIEALKTKLGGAGTDTVRMDADPLALAIEGMSMGIIPQMSVRRFGLTVLGIGLVVLLTIMWMKVGRDLKSEIEWELAKRGEIADATRSNMGLPQKYTGPTAPAGLITGPNSKTSAAEAGITINVSAADMRKRYANDEDLLETDSLFDTLMMKADGGAVTMSALYRAYQIAILTGNPNARYMTQPTMAQKLIIIAQNRDDVRVTADGIVQGWLLKPTEAKKTENVNV
jgi:hypothetical protein